MKEVYVVDGVRTAIGSFGGSLKDIAPTKLAAAVTREVVRLSRLDPARVGHIVFGQVIPTDARDTYLARVAALDSGLPIEVPALTLNRLCGSGLQAIISAAQSIMLGDASVAIAGGSECMSRAPFLSQTMRWGQRMGDSTLHDALKGALTDPFESVLMGVTAENVADKHGICRAEQDALALRSHRRAARAQREGRFASQILPIEVKGSGKSTRLFDTDEHVRPDVSLDELAALRPLFRQDGRGTVTAGNASGLNDGAAALLLASAEAANEEALQPLARLVAYAHAGVEPGLMGLGPIPATRLALQRAGLSIDQLDCIESNEAFAAQACAVSKELGFDAERVNPNGSGISLGHPVGATGAIITVKLLHELQRIQGRYGLATMCIGGGQGIAAIFERV